MAKNLYTFFMILCEDLLFDPSDVVIIDNSQWAGSETIKTPTAEIKRYVHVKTVIKFLKETSYN